MPEVGDTAADAYGDAKSGVSSSTAPLLIGKASAASRAKTPPLARLVGAGRGFDSASSPPVAVSVSTSDTEGSVGVAGEVRVARALGGGRRDQEALEGDLAGLGTWDNTWVS